MGNYVWKCVTVMESKGGMYPSLIQTIKQKGNDKRAFYNVRQLQ